MTITPFEGLIGLSILAGFWTILAEFKAIKRALEAITDSKRLSTILSIESKKDLDIKPEDFEPKKDVLIAKMLEVLNDKEMRERYRMDPDTFAFCILYHSGYDAFVAKPVDVRKPLVRVLANNDFLKAAHLVRQMVKAL